jgi:hypothetical protein
MQNSYIVDAFLSATVWMAIIYLYFSCRSKVSQLNAVTTPDVFLIAITKLLKPSILIALPFIALLGFMLWRFYGFMLASQTWGAGGMGLLASMFCIGVPLIWLQVLLICVRHSRYVDPAPKLNEPAPKPNNARGAYT